MTTQRHHEDDGTGRPSASLAIGTHQVGRIGYGAMQLERVERRVAALLLRRALDAGVNHIDTASFYGAATVNAHLRAILHPYPGDLVIVSKVGARHLDGAGPLVAAQRPAELRAQVHTDLTTLGLDRVEVVNLRRLDSAPGIIAQGDQVVPLEDQLAELVALRDDGLVGAIGLSNVSAEQLSQALPAQIVCVQNGYNLLSRSDEALLALCSEHDVAWVPFCPLGSAFDHMPAPADNATVRTVAADAGCTPTQAALAWLLEHDPHIGLIPGTRTIEHLDENLAAGALRLTSDQIARLDAVAA